MPVRTRYRTSTAAAVVTALVLVLIFGSPWYVDWVHESVEQDTALGWFLHLLAWPAWSFDPDLSMRVILANAIRAILLVVFTGVFVYLLAGTQLGRARGTLAQFFAGWGGYVFAGATAGLLAALVLSDPTALGVLQAAAAGAIYGLFVGWIVGAAVLGTYRGRP